MTSEQDVAVTAQSHSLTLQMFVYLQLLDLMTTLVGFRLGLSEASPFIRLMMNVGPGIGVLASKVIALGLAAICIHSRRFHIIQWITYWYAALVVWNLTLILSVNSQ